MMLVVVVVLVLKRGNELTGGLQVFLTCECPSFALTLR